MTLTEFSNEFDYILDSYRRFKDFDNKEELDSIEFNEYEKSIFLTKAQEQLVLDLYQNNLSDQYSFEKTELLRRSLNELVSTVELTELEQIDNLVKLSPKSKLFQLPQNLWLITYEQAIITNNSQQCNSELTALVIPTTQDQIYKKLKNPFRGVSKTRVLRLDISDKIIELISEYPISKYIVRYISKPSPIILEDLGELTIDGQNGPLECKLSSIVHRDILNIAVDLAISSRIKDSVKQ